MDGTSRAVDEKGGFVNFRETVTKTNLLIDWPKAIRIVVEAVGE